MDNEPRNTRNTRKGILTHGRRSLINPFFTPLAFLCYSVLRSATVSFLLLFRQLNRGDSGVDRFIVAEKSHSIDMLGAVADNFRCYNIPGFLSNIGEIEEAGHVGLNQADGVKMKAFELFFSLWRCTAQQHGYRIGTRSADNACRKHENHLPYALSYVEESGEKRQSIAELLRIFAL